MTDNKKQKMKHFPHIFLVFASLMLTLSCSDEQLKQDNIPGSEESIFTIDRIDFNPLGDSIVLAFTVESPWTVSASASWISLSQHSGKSGTYSIIVSADLNKTRKDLAAEITFATSDGQISKDIPVFQDYPYLNVKVVDKSGRDMIQRDSLHFLWNDSQSAGFQPYTMTVESNVDWKIDLEDVYGGANFTFSQVKGYGDASIAITPTESNLDKRPYDCILSMKAYMDNSYESPIGDCVNSYNYTMHQRNLRFLLNGDCEDVNVVVDELNVTVDGGDIEIDSERPWSVDYCPEWVSVSAKSGSDISNIHVQANSANPTREERTGIISLRSAESAFRLITVTQKPYIFEESKSEVHINNDGTSSDSFELITTGPWKIDSVPDWISVEPMEGDGAALITCTGTSQNLETADLAGNLIIKSTLNDIADNVKTIQDRFHFDVDVPSILGNLPTINTNKYGVIFDTSGPWTLTSDAQWLSVSKQEGGAGQTTVQMGANSENPNANMDRHATVRVVSTIHKNLGIDLHKDISIMQRKFTFIINPDTQNVPAYTTTKKLALSVQASAGWEISCPSWLKADITKGDGMEDKVVYLTPQTNTAKSIRKGTVSVICSKYSQTKSFEVVQDAFVFDNSNVTFSVPTLNSSPYTVKFNCTEEAGWEILSYGWSNPSKVSGTGNGEIIFTPTDNIAFENRSEEVKIYSKVTGEYKKVIFNQAKFEFNKTAENFSYTELETSQHNISIICSGEWSVVNKPSWITVSAASGTGNKTITFYPSKNIETAERSATFYIQSDKHGSSLRKPITVRQAAYKFDSKKESHDFEAINDSGANFNVSVLCSGAWEVQGIPDWISVSPTSGKGSQTGEKGSVKLTPSTNATTNARMADINIVSSDNPNLKKTVSIYQKAFIFEISANSLTFSDQSTKTLSVTSSANWTCTVNADWLSISPTTGAAGKSTVSVTPTQNKTGKARTTKLTFSDKYGHSKEVQITQESAK